LTEGFPGFSSVIQGKYRDGTYKLGPCRLLSTFLSLTLCRPKPQMTKGLKIYSI